MKKLFYFFATVIVISSILTIVFSNVSPFPILGNNFLTNLERNDYLQAYNSFSQEFKKRTSLDTFTEQVKHSELDQYHSVKWTNESHDNDKGVASIIGIVTTKQNKKFNIQIDFIKINSSMMSNDAWRINTIKVEEVRKRDDNVNLK